MALRSWSQPTLPKATLEDAADPVLGWTAQHTAGPTQRQAYAPWDARHVFEAVEDITDASSAPTTAAATTGGTLTAAGGPYVYAYAFGTAKSQSKVSTAASGQAVTGSTAKVTVTVPSLPTWADRIYVYRQVSGALAFLGTTTTTTYVDDGAVTPNPSLAPFTTAGGNAVLKEVNH